MMLLRKTPCSTLSKPLPILQLSSRKRVQATDLSAMFSLFGLILGLGRALLWLQRLKHDCHGEGRMVILEHGDVVVAQGQVILKPGHHVT